MPTDERVCPTCGRFGLVEELHAGFVVCRRCDHHWDSTGREPWAARVRPSARASDSEETTMIAQQTMTCPSCHERALTGPADGGLGQCGRCGRRHLMGRRPCPGDTPAQAPAGPAKQKHSTKDRPPDPRRTHDGPDRRRQKPV